MLETLVGAVTEAVFGHLLEQAGLGERVRALLGRDPQRLAFQLAFTRSYAAFSQHHAQWTNALFDEPFLTGSAAPLLARCLLRDNPPSGAELAAAWADHLALSDQTRAKWLAEATTVAGDFLATLERELRARDEFQPIFDSRAFDATAAASTQTAEHTAAMTQQLEKIFAELRKRPAPSTPTTGQTINNPTPNQGAQGTFNGPVYFNYGSQSAPPTPPASPANPPAAPRSPDVNPFVAGTAVAPEHFYGREEQRMSIKDRIGAIAPQSIWLVGFRRSGKSSLLRYVRDRIGEFCPPAQRPLVVSLSLAETRFHTPAGITEGLRRGIERATGSAPWPREDNADPWTVDEGLAALRDSGQRLIVLIDEFEQIGARLGEFQDWGNDWREKAGKDYFALVLATLRPIDAIYQKLGLTSPFGNIFTIAELGPLTRAEWHALVHTGFTQTDRTVSDADLALIDELAGGLPYYTQLAASLLWRHGNHQHTRSEFARQAEPRFAELRRDLHDAEHHALRYVAGVAGSAPPAANLQAKLQRHGLLRTDGQLFSSALADYLRGQR